MKAVIILPRVTEEFFHAYLFIQALSLVALLINSAAANSFLEHISLWH